MCAQAMLNVQRLTQTYPTAHGALTVLHEVSFSIEAGASLVQVYTGFIYRGPELIGEARRAFR